ncbi:MAG: oligosaccharide MFS transporter [Selenomonadaceae bacterium]|nr:oligosaccharide MFS transporter [Selenomonadaceae bacterium]
MGKIFNRDFLNFGGLFYFYFMIWAIVLAFLPLWLKDIAGLDEAQSGFVFSSMSLIALCYHPFFGVIQDKLRYRKTLFGLIAIALLFMGPFFNFAFQSLLDFNVYAGALLGSCYLSLCFFGGVGVVESYIEKVSRKNGFEYGHVRLFGSLAGATATFIGGYLYVNDPGSIFWFGSGSAALLCLLLYLARVKTTGSEEEQREEKAAAGINKKDVLHILGMKTFWFFALIIVGTASIYDVFDQQFPNYYVTFFDSKEEGIATFSKLCATQTALEAILMVFAPALVNKIGAKKGLLLFGFLTFVRIAGSAYFTTPIMLSFFRLIAAFEMPLMLVSVMKYISGVFDVRLSATVYLLGFNLAKQGSVVIFSTIAGGMYASMGFQTTYIFLAASVLIITLISCFTLKNDKKIEAPTEEQFSGVSLAAK